MSYIYQVNINVYSLVFLLLIFSTDFTFVFLSFQSTSQTYYTAIQADSQAYRKIYICPINQSASWTQTDNTTCRSFEWPDFRSEEDGNTSQIHQQFSRMSRLLQVSGQSVYDVIGTVKKNSGERHYQTGLQPEISENRVACWSILHT